MTKGNGAKEEGELGAVYMGEGERSESLVSIPYLAMVIKHPTSSPQGREYSTVRATLQY